MYRPHESREDTVLFPAIRSLMTAKEYDDLGEQFEDREHVVRRAWIRRHCGASDRDRQDAGHLRPQPIHPQAAAGGKHKAGSFSLWHRSPSVHCTPPSVSYNEHSSEDQLKNSPARGVCRKGSRRGGTLSGCYSTSAFVVFDRRDYLEPMGKSRTAGRPQRRSISSCATAAKLDDAGPD
jgi:hypothetical protein